LALIVSVFPDTDRDIPSEKEHFELVNTVGVDDTFEQTLNSSVDLFQDVFVCLFFETLDESGENGIEALVESTARNTDKGSESTSVESGDRLHDKRWNEDREDAVGSDLLVRPVPTNSFGITYTHNLLQGLQSCLGSLSGVAHGLEQRRDRLIDRLSSHVVLHGVKGLRGGRSDNTGRVDQCGSDSGDDSLFVVGNDVLARGSPVYQLQYAMDRRDLHDVGESKTSAFLGTFVWRRDGLLKNRQDFTKDAFSVLPA